MRTVRNKKEKRAVLLKRTMSAGKRRLCKSPKKSQSQFSWDERARVVKLKAVQRISKKVIEFGLPLDLAHRFLVSFTTPCQ